jgi:magnesium chelatase family protein
MILDRIDMHIFVKRISCEKLDTRSEMTTEKMREQVIIARKRQKERFAGDDMMLNSGMDATLMKQHCRLDDEGRKMMSEAYEKMPLSMRTYVKTICVARTIADLEESDEIKVRNLAEALRYRGKER